MKTFDATLVRLNLLEDGSSRGPRGETLFDWEGFEEDIKRLGNSGYEVKCTVSVGEVVGVVLQREIVEEKQPAAFGALSGADVAAALDGEDPF